MKAVYVVGTLDTKRDELLYVRDVVEATGMVAVLVDVGTTEHQSSADVKAGEVASHHPDGASAVVSSDRGEAVGAMAVAFEAYVRANVASIGGIIGIGGSGGTAIITPGMRALPVGRPKVMVSTVASGNVAPYVGPADIAMMYSVTDVAGLNRISRQVLGNAANAIAGMVHNPVPASASDLPAIGLTMFGVTTPLVTQLVDALKAEYDPLVFHTTGTGGQSMEKLVDSGMVTAVLDMTTTEVADYLVGGVFPAGPDRFGAIARTRVPYVGSCGALDMVNFGAVESVPAEFADRLFHVHNPQVTLMRTTVAENQQFGAFIAAKLNDCEGPVRFLLPEGGVSLLDAPGQPFFDPEADEALFTTIESEVDQTRDRQIIRVPHPINHPKFVAAALGSFHEITGRGVMSAPSRTECLARFRDMIERRVPIVGGGAGTGLSAKCEEAGGIDLIVIYNSGRYRMAGRGSLAGLLAYGNANEIVVDMAREVLPVVQHVPVLAGVNATDPFYMPEVFLPELKRLGFAGVQNFPTVGLIDGVFRQNLEETGMGYQHEVDMIGIARELDLLTTPYVFDEASAVAMTEAGADIIVCHMGLTTGGSIGADTALTLDGCVELIDRCAAAARGVRPDVIVLCHGGPIANPEDSAYVLQRARDIHGFYGASSMERLPTEQALKAQTEAFKAVTF